VILKEITILKEDQVFEDYFIENLENKNLIIKIENNCFELLENRFAFID
jgi:hypothetical protein